MKTSRETKRRLLLLVPFAALLASLTACGSTAPEAATIEPQAKQEGARPAELTPQIQAVEDVMLAHQLAELGERTSSPLALAAAAQILMNTPTQAVQEQKEGDTGQDRPTDRSGKSAAPRTELEPAGLLARARQMAGGNQNVLALVQQLEGRTPAAPRGAVGGPRRIYDAVDARTTDIWRFTFRGNEPAQIRVRGDGDTDLDCYVYNQNGQLVAIDDDYTDYCILNWWPSTTGTHRLEIRNLGRVYNAYVLTTN